MELRINSITQYGHEKYFVLVIECYEWASSRDYP